MSDDLVNKGMGIVVNNDSNIDNLINEFVLIQRSKHTRKSYRTSIKQFAKYADIKTTSDLASSLFHKTVLDVNSFLSTFKKLDAKNDNRLINPATVNNKAYALTSFFEYLVKAYNYPKNPLLLFKPYPVKEFSSTTSLTRLEIKDMLGLLAKNKEKSLSKFRDYLAIHFMFLLALRRSEVVNIGMGDMDMTQLTINVYQKGGRYKLLPLHPKFAKEISEYISMKKDKGFDSNYLFSPLRNTWDKLDLDKPMRPEYLVVVVKKLALVVAPEKKITPHSLRKSFTEIGLDNGEDYISILNTCGWSSLAMVKFYDTRDKLKNNASNRISNDFL